ncbi:MAG: dihydrodipicolinate synthase family protein [Eisenbergiella massiliensis]
MLAGGDGCIAGLSNLVPGLCHAWTEAFAREDLAEAAAIQQKIDLLMEIYQVGTPFIPYIKEAMAIKGIIGSAASSLPFPEADQGDSEKIRGILKKAGLL